MMRREDWFEQLAAVIEKHDALPFDYGSSDCAQIAFDAIEAITGELPERFCGEYHDAASARSRMHERGAQNLAELLAAELEEIHPVFAGPGDVGIADYPGAIIGGGVVVVGLDVIGKGYHGTVRLPRSALSRAFRVK
jgi:hypothetical protein